MPPAANMNDPATLRRLLDRSKTDANRFRRAMWAAERARAQLEVERGVFAAINGNGEAAARNVNANRMVEPLTKYDQSMKLAGLKAQIDTSRGEEHIESIQSAKTFIERFGDSQGELDPNSDAAKQLNSLKSIVKIAQSHCGTLECVCCYRPITKESMFLGMCCYTLVCDECVLRDAHRQRWEMGNHVAVTDETRFPAVGTMKCPTCRAPFADRPFYELNNAARHDVNTGAVLAFFTDASPQEELDKFRKELHVFSLQPAGKPDVKMLVCARVPANPSKKLQPFGPASGMFDPNQLGPVAKELGYKWDHEAKMCGGKAFYKEITLEEDGAPDIEKFSPEWHSAIAGQIDTLPDGATLRQTQVRADGKGGAWTIDLPYETMTEAGREAHARRVAFREETNQIRREKREKEREKKREESKAKKAAQLATGMDSSDDDDVATKTIVVTVTKSGAGKEPKRTAKKRAARYVPPETSSDEDEEISGGGSSSGVNGRSYLPSDDEDAF